MNNAMIAGRLAENPVREPPQGGEAVTVLSLAVPQPVSWDPAHPFLLFKIEVRGTMAETCMASFREGSQLVVVGRLEPESSGPYPNGVVLKTTYISPV